MKVTSTFEESVYTDEIKLSSFVIFPENFINTKRKDKATLAHSKPSGTNVVLSWASRDIHTDHAYSRCGY